MKQDADVTTPPSGGVPTVPDHDLLTRTSDLMSENRTAEAEKLLRDAITANAGNAALHHLLAIALEAQGRTAESEAEYHTAISLAPPDDVARYEFDLGIMLGGAGRRADAAAAFDRALIARPGFAAAESAWAKVLAADGDLTGAIARVRKALAAPADDDVPREDLWVRLGGHLNDRATAAEKPDYEEIVAAMHDAAREYPKNPNLHNYRGMALMELERFDQAAEAFRAAKAVAVESQAVFSTNLAVALIRLRRYDRAIKECKTALQYDATYASAHAAWGEAATKKSKTEEAAEHYSRAADLITGASDADANRLRTFADALVGLGALQAAEKALRRSLAVAPDVGATYSALGSVLQSQGRYDEARAAYEAALAARIPDPDALYAEMNLGLTYYGRRRFDQAIEHFRRALQLDPGNVTAHRLWGNALAEKGEHAAAVKRYRQAIARAPASDLQAIAGLRVNIGIALAALSKFEDAAREFERARDADPATPGLYFAWGNLLSAQQRISDAIAMHQKTARADAVYPYSLHNVADAYWRQGQYSSGRERWSQARAAYEAVVSERLKERDYFFFSAFAGVLHDVYGDFDRASEMYETACALEPNDPRAPLGRVLLTLEQRDLGSGRERAEANARAWRDYTVAKRLVNEDPFWSRDVDLLRQLGEVQTALRELTAARATLAKAAEVDSESAAVLSATATLQALTGEPLRAIDTFERAKARAPFDLTTRTALADAYLSANQPAAAEKELKDVLTLTSEHIEAWIGLGEVYTAMADNGERDLYEDAVDSFSKAIVLANRGSGKRIPKIRLAAAYYSRGYARVKTSESADPTKREWYLADARNDFAAARARDRDHAKARRAIAKLDAPVKRLLRGIGERLPAMFILVFAVLVFAVAQASYVLGRTPAPDKNVPGWLAWTLKALQGAHTTEASYVLLTFGSIIMMIAGLYLPRILKLRFGNIELEKSVADQLAAPTALGITRATSLPSMTTTKL